MKTLACIFSVIALFFSLTASASAIQPTMKKSTETQQIPTSPPNTKPVPAPVQPQPVPPLSQPVPVQTPQALQIQQVPKGVAVQQLPSSIMINPAHLQGIKVAAFNGLTPEFYNAWKQVGENYNALSSGFPKFDQQVKNIVAASQACKTKNYTQLDMVAAGCLPTDTLEACSKKLYEKCMAPMNTQISEVALYGMIFGFLKDSAATANSEAYKTVSNLIK